MNTKLKYCIEKLHLRAISLIISPSPSTSPAGLAQSVERETLNLKVGGSTPPFGYSFKNNLDIFFVHGPGVQKFFFIDSGPMSG